MTMMSDIESIIIYGYSGYVIITDFYLLVFGIVQKLNGLKINFPYQSDAVFFVRKLFGVAIGLTLILVYRSELLDFFWTLILFSILTMPEAIWLIYKDTKSRKQEINRQVDSDEAGRVYARDFDE